MGLALTPVLYSYVTTMLKPSSLPLGVRSVEWVRANGGAWLVNDVERLYYKWKAPKPGGPALKTLPKVAGANGSPSVRGLGAKSNPARLSVPSYRPLRLAPVIRPVLPGEGVWVPVSQHVGGRPAVLVTTFRSEADYPRNVAYVAWIDHSRTDISLYPGRYEPPSGSPRGQMQVP